MEGDGDGLMLCETEADSDTDGDIEGLIEAEGDTDGDTDGLIEGDMLAEGDTEGDSEGEIEALGLIEAEVDPLHDVSKVPSSQFPASVQDHAPVPAIGQSG